MDTHFWAHAIPNILTALVHAAFLYGAYRFGAYRARQEWDGFFTCSDCEYPHVLDEDYSVTNVVELQP